MTTDSNFDRRIQDYLEVGPIELPDRVLWAARAQVQTTRRRRRLDRRWPWRTFQMSQSMRWLLAAGGALAVAVAIGAGVLGPLSQHTTGPGTSTGPGVSPSASAAPSPSAPPTVAPRSTPPAAGVPVYPDQAASHLDPAWEAHGTGSGSQFGVPAVAPDGRIWIASSAESAFRIYRPDGTLAETWGTPGAGAGHFNFSIGQNTAGAVAFAPDGSFWVADFGNYRVQHFGKDRRFISSWGTSGSGDGEFLAPIDIDVDEIGDVFVGDDTRQDIQVFTSSGQFLRKIGPGEFVAGRNGYVTTNLLPNGRPGVVQYQPDGTVQGGFDMPVLLPRPMGIAFDGDWNIYVVGFRGDDTTGRLIRFDETGVVKNVWDVPGHAVAASADGTAAYVLAPDGDTLQGYVLPHP